MIIKSKTPELIEDAIARVFGVPGTFDRVERATNQHFNFKGTDENGLHTLFVFIFQHHRYIAGDFVIYHDNTKLIQGNPKEWFKVVCIEHCDEYARSIHTLTTLLPLMTEMSACNAYKYICKLELLNSKYTDRYKEAATPHA
jgi:hypothetical protein